MTEVERHSTESVTDFDRYNVITIPALGDNFMYLIVDKSSKNAAAVDPVDPESLLNIVSREGVSLSKVLITHHHWDHAGGNKKLVELFKKVNDKSLEIYGGDDRIDELNNKVKHNEEISLGSLKIRCLFTPCHTTGHICYFVDCDKKPAVFTGDTLFIAGCGRFFEGTADQMYNALVEILGKLPPNTAVFCGHEYTVSNLKFVLSVDNDNSFAVKKLEWATNQRASKLPTVPSSIEQELKFNIFMKCIESSIQNKIGASSKIECMDKLRTLKNEFKS